LATLDNVSVDIAVVLGTTSMPIHQVLRLGRGAIIELDASEEDEVRILANNLPVAKGTVIVSGNKIARGDLALRRTHRRPLSRYNRPVTSAPSRQPGAHSTHMRPWRNW
jgi:flagellar motor switch protein FliN/FliY